jgi:hypothetical protein
MKKPILVERKFIGINILAGGNIFPQAYILYEERYSDGTIKTTRGDSVHSTPSFDDINGGDRKNLRGDLFCILNAAAILNNELKETCLRLDRAKGIGEFKYQPK